MPEDLISHTVLKSVYPVKISGGGGVTIYSEPSCYPTEEELSLLDPKWKVSIGVHPKKIHELTDERFKDLTRLMGNPRVCALGEIGLDFGSPERFWENQEVIFKKLIKEVCVPEKPVVLHLRGSKKHGSDASASACLILSQFADPTQKIHLHCFTGTPQDVHRWRGHFPNAYFGFTALVSSFDERQRLALREIAQDRLLIETESPYFSQRKTFANTPAFIGDVALKVSKILGVGVSEVLSTTKKNAERLYF